MRSVSTRAGERAGVVVATVAQIVVEAGETVGCRSRSVVNVPGNTGGVLGKGESAGEEASEEEQRGGGEGLHVCKLWLGNSL